MKKILHSLLAYLLAAMLLVQSAPFAFAAGVTPSVSVADNSCTVGSSVTVTVTGKNFENLGALPLEFYYDADVLTLNSVSIGSSFQTYFSDINTNTAGKVIVNLVYEEGITVSDAALVYLYFTVAADATVENTEIAVAVGDARDGELNAMAVSSASGTLTINERPQTSSTLRLSASTNTSTISKGDTVTLQVNNSSYLSLSGGKFRVSFDDALFQVKSAVFDSYLLQGEYLTDINDDVPGQVTLSYISDTAVSNWPLFSVELEVIGDVDTTTTLTYAVIEAYDANNAAYQTYSGSTQVTLVKLPEVVDYPNFFVNSTEFVVGEEAISTLTLETSDVAAADFSLHFDPEILEVASVENISTETDSKAYVMVDETTWDNGIVSFTYLNTAGTVQDLPLLKITWNVLSAKSDAELTLSGTGVKDVNIKDVMLEYVGETSPVYTTETIFFNANGGSGTMANQTVRSGVATTLNANAFTRVDYTFVGWNTKSDGTGMTYSDKASVTATSATTLYAQWEINEARWGLATGENGDQLPETWAGSGTLDEAMIYAIPRSSGEFAYIQLLRDVDITEPLLFKLGMKVVLDLNGNDISRKKLAEATVDGNVIQVNGTVLLCDTSSNEIENQGKITGGKNIGDGAGVYVAGTFTMNGGTISGNYANRNGGGVYASGTFTMNGGMISGNTASEKGGGVYLYGNFTMNGGTISKNIVDNGGGVYITYGVFTMNEGATISENIAYANGGGVYIAWDQNSACSFVMNGGAVCDNTTEGAGGGVYNRKVFTMNGGVISGNSNDGSGGGVYNEETFTMNGGAISQNTAKASGGGVINYGTFTMSSGTISGNTATYDKGGGVYVANSTIFTMTGGSIMNNTALYLGGGGVYVNAGTIEVSGESKIIENKNASGTANNVYLASDKAIAVIDTLDENASIGVTTASKPTNDAPITVAQGGGDSAYTLTANDATKFTSDSGYDVVFDSTNSRVNLEFTLLLGDVNSDGSIDIGDHQRLFEHLQGINIITDKAVLIAADVNKDGTIDIGDHQRLFEHLQGINPLS